MADVVENGNGAFRVPELLTQEEAIKLLRLDSLGLKNPKEALRHLRRTGQLGFVKIAGKVLIPRSELAGCLRRASVPMRAR